MIRQRYIYRFTSPSNRVYVGQTVNIKKRMGQYKSCNPSQTLLYRSIKKYGLENHTLEILEDLICDPRTINDLEKYWIEFYKCNFKRYPKSKGLNLNDGGAIVNSQGMSAESREKMSKSAKGRIPWNKGKTGIYSQETIEKIRQANIGKKYPNKPKMSEEAKRKISATLTGRKQSPETIEKRLNKINTSISSVARGVVDTVTGIYFDSVKEAAKAYNVKPANLSRYLGGSRPNRTNLMYTQL